MPEYKIIVVSVVILFLILSLYREWFRPVMTFFACTIVLMLSGLLSANDLLSGFANQQIAVIFLLLILSDVIQKTSILELALKNLFSTKLSYRAFLPRMMVSVSSLSAFVNNTPLVAMMIPYVYDWGKKKRIPASKLLIPLSFATILGGMTTLVGTSTNLVVNGFVIDAGFPSLGFFDFSYAGIPLTIIGILYLLFIGARLLPMRKDALSDFTEKSREYMMEAQVQEGSNFIGKTIEQAELRNLRGLFLVEILRNEQKITPVGRNEVLQKNDILIFAGATETIIDLLKNPKDLSLPSHSHMPQQGAQEIVEVVVSTNSNIGGKMVKETNFRGNYDAAIVAINRNGEKLTGKIGEVILRSGDLLLLVTGKDFRTRTRNTQDFHVISRLQEMHKAPGWKLGLIVGGTIAAFALSALNIVPLFTALLFLLCIIAVIKVVKLSDIKSSMDFDLLLILVMALGLGKAITNSGSDKVFGDAIISLFQPMNSTIGALLGVYIVTNIVTMFVTNAAAVAITFPIALSAATSLGVDPKPFFLAVAFAGSADFVTPFGYQTNLMVYGPGGYKFRDYVRVGWPLTLIYMIVVIGVLGYMYELF